MEKKRYLSMFVAALLGGSAMAATWNTPTVTGVEIASGDSVYIFNTLAEEFLNIETDEATVVDAEGLALCATASGDCYMFSTAEGAYLYWQDYQECDISTDYNSDHILWTVTAQGDGTYTIRPDVDNDDYGEEVWPDCWLAWLNDGTSDVLPLVEDDESIGMYWKFVDEEEYNSFYSLKALSDAMTEAQDDGIDITSALAVYENSSSTYDEIIAAADELEDAIHQYNIDNATLDNPTEYNEAIVNHSFDEYFEDGSSDIYGWSQDPEGAFWLDDDDLDGDYTNMGRWTGDAMTFGDAIFYQQVTDLPTGQYIITVPHYNCIDQVPGNTTDDDSDEEDYWCEGNYLYATTALGTEETTLCSNARWASATASVTCFVTDGTLEVGVKMEDSEANWLHLSGFDIMFYGKDAITEQLQDIIDEASAITDGMNSTYSDALADGISRAETLVAAEETDIEACMEMAEELTEIINEAYANIEAYQEIQEVYDDAQEIFNSLSDEATDEVIALADYLDEMDIETIVGTYPYTTEELQDIIDELNELSTVAYHSMVQVGDVTSYLTNPSFTDNADGWDMNEENTVLSDFNFSNDCMEAFYNDFDISQTLVNMPYGTYTLTVQAFERTDWNENIDPDFAEDPQSVYDDIDCYIYMNSYEMAVQSVMDCGETDITSGYEATVNGYIIPNSMYDSSLFFAEGYYTNTLEGFCSTGELIVGIKDEVGDGWDIWDNFTLYYNGEDLDKALELLQQQYDEASPYLDEKMNGDIKDILEEACAAAEEVLSNDDADFDAAVVAIQLMEEAGEALEGADESIEAFDELNHANSIAAEDLAVDGVTDTEAGQELSALYATYSANYENEATGMTNDVIADVIEQYETLGTQAKIAAGFSDGDDITYLLRNNSYEDQWNIGEGVSGVYNPPYGWHFLIDSVECTTAQEMYDAGLNSYVSPDSNVDTSSDGGDYGYCLQSGDFPDVYMYQTVEGLPAGKYEVTVLLGVWNNEYEYRLAGQRLLANTVAMYYGHEDEYYLDSLEVTHPYETERTFGEYDETCIEDNNNSDADPLYLLSVTVDIEDGEDLTLGVRTDGIWENVYKLTEEPDGWNNCGWCKFDNMRLYCTELYSTGIKDISAEDGDVESEDYYTVDGARISTLKKGVNIVRQKMEDGSTVTKKVIVK